MKKTIFTITSLGLLAILSCWLVFHVSCKKENDCSDCYLTSEQTALIIYMQGQKVIFKNDSTNIFDTLFVKDIGSQLSSCSSPCDQQSSHCVEVFSFSHFNEFNFEVSTSSQIPIIYFNNLKYIFELNVPTQIATVNSSTFNDVYSVHVDSTTIVSNGDKLKVPWKIDYSKSKGFVRFYMINGQTWSKL
jgi:hypothetical protein